MNVLIQVGTLRCELLTTTANFSLFLWETTIFAAYFTERHLITQGFQYKHFITLWTLKFLWSYFDESLRREKHIYDEMKFILQAIMRFIELSNDLRKIVSTPVLDKTTHLNNTTK